MKSKLTRPVILAGICAIVLAACATAWFFGTYTWVDSVQYRKDTAHLNLSGKPISDLGALKDFQALQSLDLRGTGITVEQYDQLASQFPDCQIRWDIPFQGGFLADDTQEVKLSSLSEKDLAALQHLKSLKTVDASQCKSYARLGQLKAAFPEAGFIYEVPLAGAQWPHDTKSVTLVNAQALRLMERLAWLPELESVHLQGVLPAPEQMDMLIAEYPGLDFTWGLEIVESDPEAEAQGLDPIVTVLEMDTQELEFSEKHFTLEELEALLYYCPELKKLTILGSGVANEDLLKLREQNPQLELIWDVTIGDRTFRTDIAEMDLSNVALTDVSQVENLFPCFPNLTWVDMSYTGLSSEVLDALNQRHENIRIVWTITITSQGDLRTDATYFMPWQMSTMVLDEHLTELKYCTDLVCIDLGHMNIRNCEFVRYLPKLKYLIMADSMLKSVEPLRGHQNLVYLEIFLSDVLDYTPLLECPNLVDLNICNNRGDLTPLAKMTWLDRLWVAPLDGYRYSESILMLQKALPNTQVVYSPNSTGCGWRHHPRYFEMRDILGMYYMN